jgi:hypothetical protein
MSISRRSRWVYEPFGDSLSDEQVRFGSVWQFWPNDTSKWLYEPDEYRGGLGLYLAMERAGDPPTSFKLKQRIAAWCDFLPTLADVRRVWLDCHVPQKLFDAVCRMPALESLHVKWGGVDDLTPMTALASLRHVHLGSLTKVVDMRPVASMSQLVSLELENFKRVTQYDDLSALSSLEMLAIQGGVWAAQRMESLEPIGLMRGLRSFSMINTSLQSRSLDPLLSLRNLEHFNAAWHLSDAELAKLRTLPSLKYGNIFEERAV